MATVEFQNAQKIYANGVHALRDMTLAVADGEFVVLVGPSGCGKSTLLRMTAGLESVSSGVIRIGSREVNNVEPAQRNIAMVFQNYALYPHMTVYGNMAYGLRNAGASKSAIDAAVNRAAEILELEALLKRKPRELSGGQRQRVAMGRAIVRSPDVFLFDEPLSNLDAKLRVQMRVEIKKLQQDLETTSLYVTHDQVEAMTMADRLVVMNAGVAEQVGTPMDVYNHPATRFVASFIGSPAMNFLPATLTNDGTHARLPNDVEIELRGRHGDVVDPNVSLGVRPEHLRPSTNGRLFDMVVSLAEPLGAETLVHGAIANTEHVVTLRLPGATRFRKGDTIALAADASDLHVFEASSGKRINST